MLTFSKLLAGVAIAAALVITSNAGASADERSEWLKMLREQRGDRLAPVTPLQSPAAARAAPRPGIARATVYTRQPARSGAASATRFTRATPVQTALAAPGRTATAPAPGGWIAAAQSRTIGGRILVQPLSPEENRSRATQLRRVGLSPNGGVPQMDPKFLPAVVDYAGPFKPGTIVIDTVERYLYLVQEGATARRYGVGVGRPGFQWAGEHRVSLKREWPGWTPPPQMRKRQPELPAFMEGGPHNPLGARAMYLGSSLYRIHGSNAPWTIGAEVSSGCIRMRNEDVTELYEMVPVGTKVVVTR